MLSSASLGIIAFSGFSCFRLVLQNILAPEFVHFNFYLLASLSINHIFKMGRKYTEISCDVEEFLLTQFSSVSSDK